MKRSLSKQFIVILLIPLLIILTTNYSIINYIRKTQTENQKKYCQSTIDNIEINISALTTSMKKTATMFSSEEETQSFLQSSSDAHQLQRQSFFDLVDLSRSYTPDLVDILVWDGSSTTSIISYIPAHLENFIIKHFKNTETNTNSYFEFYIQPITQQPALIYFSPVFMTTYSEDFGKQLGNIAVVCNSDTMNRLVRSTTDIPLNIADTDSGQILYTNGKAMSVPADSKHTDITSKEIPSTNLTINAAINDGKMEFFNDNRLAILIILAVLSLFYLVYIAFAVHLVIIRPIHKLNNQIETMDYQNDEIQIETSLKNEIGSIASHTNALLTKISVLNQHNINSQARLYEMELSKKQTQLYAYQSQINPHFLYNMLQCMRGISLMHGIREVAQICTNMAELFRYSIKGASLIYLEDELDIIDKYLYMIRVRFQNKITYTLDVAPDTRKCLIPKMILQPIVENAIFHGLESIEEDGLLNIRTSNDGEDLYIHVEDNGIGFSLEVLEELKLMLAEDIPSEMNTTFNEAKGLGIINIHNKIRLYEGLAYGINIDSTPRHTVVTIHLNARLEK